MPNDTPGINSAQFIALKRGISWTAQATAGSVIGLLPLVLGGFILYMTFTHLDSEPLSESWVAVVVGGAFALVGLLMEFSAIPQFIASRLPEAEVAIDRLPLRAGETFRLRVHHDNLVIPHGKHKARAMAA